VFSFGSFLIERSVSFCRISLSDTSSDLTHSRFLSVLSVVLTYVRCFRDQRKSGRNEGEDEGDEARGQGWKRRRERANRIRKTGRREREENGKLDQEQGLGV
jgi:hypothetical protein